jgi:hypothetical protein
MLKEPQGHSLRGRPKRRWWNCVQILINSKLKTGKRGLHCIVLWCIEEEEKKERKTRKMRSRRKNKRRRSRRRRRRRKRRRRRRRKEEEEEKGEMYK